MDNRSVAFANVFVNKEEFSVAKLSYYRHSGTVYKLVKGTNGNSFFPLYSVFGALIYYSLVIFGMRVVRIEAVEVAVVSEHIGFPYAQSCSAATCDDRDL